MTTSTSPVFSDYTVEQWNSYISGKDKIDLANKNLDDSAIINLAEVLKTNETINLIDLSQNKITKIGADSLAEAVRKNKYLGQNLTQNVSSYGEMVALKLDNNSLEKEGVWVLIKVFQETHRSLFGLIYENNGLTADEEYELNQMLKRPKINNNELNTLRWTT
jgi:hypothetical protein